jgi:transcriptional repressor NrdR
LSTGWGSSSTASGGSSTPRPQVIDSFVHSSARLSFDVQTKQRRAATVRCPYCRHPDSRVVDSREQDEGQAIRRRRSCLECGRRFTTVEEAMLSILKRSGVTEPFSRAKVISGVRRACQGRPVDEDALAQLAQTVEDAIRATGSAEIPSDEVGLAILGPLRDLDEVAYLRFASVYQAFSSIDDFDKAIADLRSEHRKHSL